MAVTCSAVISSDVLFYLTNHPKLKDIQFIIIEDKENKKVFTFENLELQKNYFLFPQTSFLNLCDDCLCHHKSASTQPFFLLI